MTETFEDKVMKTTLDLLQASTDESVADRRKRLGGRAAYFRDLGQHTVLRFQIRESALANARACVVASRELPRHDGILANARKTSGKLN